MKRVAHGEPEITAFRAWFTGESEDVDRDFLIGRYHAVEHSLKALSLFFRPESWIIARKNPCVHQGRSQH
jgi:hypothetical protein